MLRFMRKFTKTHSELFSRNYSDTYKYSVISDVHTRNNKDDKIKIKGWVKALRKQKENVFIDVSDGSCTERLQIFLPAKDRPQNLTTGASVTVTGKLSEAPKGHLELIATNIDVTGECVVADGYPFAPRKTYPPEYIRQFLHLRPRTNKFASLLRLRHAASKAVHDHFNEEGFFHVHTPVLTSNDCEGAGEIFMVFPGNKKLLKEMLKDGQSEEAAYFNTKAFLTVSGQLHLEAVAHSLNKVYTFGPTFRAENSKSRLHLSEFYMIEAEAAFVDNLEKVMNITEKMIKSVTETVLNKCKSDVQLVQDANSTNLDWLSKPFVTLSYDEALGILEKNSKMFSSSVDKQEGLAKEHELFLVNHCGGALIFVVNWPRELKPFYMKQCPEDSSKVAAFDLLAPTVGEIVGGSLREDNYELLKTKLPPAADLDWYLELRKFGGVPTAGFGMGFERYLQLLLGINNIKDTIPFPRWPHNCSL